MNNERIFKMSFASVYPSYLNKILKKGRTKEELHEVIFWLTGYDEFQLENVIANNSNFEYFYSNAPQINPNATLIKGVICGYRIEDIENSLMKNIRYLDKLVDELAKGKTLEKIFRKSVNH
jgi:hypothetical protein